MNSLRNISVPVVDDEEILVEMGSGTLKRLRCQLVSSLDPLAALEIFRVDPSGFDIVLAGLMMPKMTGVDLAQQSKSLNSDIPILLCTGFGHKFTHEEARELGFGGVISKPLSKKDVARAVRKTLDEQTGSYG